MARRNVRHKAAKMTIPLGIAIPVVLHAERTLRPALAGDMKLAAYRGLGVNDSGVDMAELKIIAMPYLVGAGVHFAAKHLGINRALGRAKIPFARL